MNKWREVERWKVGHPDGHSEELILERNDKKGYRLKNDFGNVEIEMDTMSALEFFKKAVKAIEDDIAFDLNDWFEDNDNDSDSDEDTDMDNDCDWGAD